MKNRNTLTTWGIVGLAAISLATVSCNEDGADSASVDPALTEKLRATEKEQAELEAQVAAMKEEARAKTKALKAEVGEKDETLSKVKDELRDVKSEKEALEAEFQEYKEQYKVSVRENAKGMKLGDVTLTSGTRLNGVVVSKWEPMGLRVTHSEGNSKVAFDELPQAVQLVFAYDPGEVEMLVAQVESKANTKPKTTRPKGADGGIVNTGTWHKKDPNGNTAPLVFTDPENTGIVNQRTTPLNSVEVQIIKLQRVIDKQEVDINELDKKMNEASARGSDGLFRSLEKRAERVQDRLKTLRANKRDLEKKLESRRA